MVFYFVQRGETLFAIAKRYQTTVHAIVAANRLEDPNAICPGQALIIPRPGEVPSPPPGGIVHLVRPGETLFHLAEKFGTSVHEVLKANQIAHPEFVLPGQQLVIPERAEPGDEWPMLGRTPGRAAVTPVELEGIPVEAWSHTPRRYVGLRPSAPVIRYERVYVGLGDGHFYSLDRHTGSVKWRMPACKGETLPELTGTGLAAPAVYDGLAYLCGPDGTVRAVDAHSGRSVWQISLDGPVTGAPAVADGILFVGCRDHHVYAIEGKTGAIIWKAQVEGAVTHPVALGDDHVYAVTDEGKLWALDAMTGVLCWRSGASPTFAPVFAELLVLVGGEAFDPTTGERVWEVDGAGHSPAVRVDQVLFPGRMVDLFTGERRAGEETTQDSVRTHLMTKDLQIFVTQDQRLVAFDLPAGEERWAVELEAPGVGLPAVVPGAIFLTLEDGSVVAYRMEADTI
ncbi:MAG: PQQ-binding-like beta-propeller repeat protein [Bacillota bacterium]